ncbi:protein kinase-like protein [Pochonia chlamydosporia 170]|uniref:non-specific serine/threonine protein kinase n=1 Tax=Pochonia chlamydosporia 170 TaxID=1380566 RepID=A0A179EY70_METCM|nr:protein kinase-like protein [Pochonia chlamydosporia 170]OAQ57849.2 protein kinase-like protein [Pochonia chlamydosporia 170]
MLFAYIKHTLEDWIFPLRMILGRKIMYDEQRSIVQVSRNQLIKGPCSQQELEAMEYAASYTSVCLPCIHRTYHRRRGLFIAMDFVQGKTLDSLWSTFTDEEKQKCVVLIWDSVRQLHACHPPASLGRIVAASISGGPVRDGAFGVQGNGPQSIGPFVDEEDFRSVLEERAEFAKFDRHPARVGFVHADLAPRNIIVKNDNQLCFIDWELAGWWPLYWERMKWHFSDFPPTPDFLYLMDQMTADERRNYE